MPDFAQTVFKCLYFKIPLKKDYPSQHISSIELQDVEIRLNQECPNPLITGLITTKIQIPKGVRKLKFMTTGISAEFYLLHPKTKHRIARLETDGWYESTSDQSDKSGKIWTIETRVRDAPVEILEGDGFDDWIGMMMRHEGEEMSVSVEGWCSAGVKTLKTKVKVKRLPVKASLNIAG